MIIAFIEFQEQIKIFGYALDIIHNITTYPLFQAILESLFPFVNLFWLLFGGYIFFKIVLPIIADALKSL